jgi:hypothetical protein
MYRDERPIYIGLVLLVAVWLVLLFSVRCH